jgi:hypothetical protein
MTIEATDKGSITIEISHAILRDAAISKLYEENRRLDVRLLELCEQAARQAECVVRKDIREADLCQQLEEKNAQIALLEQTLGLKLAERVRRPERGLADERAGRTPRVILPAPGGHNLSRPHSRRHSHVPFADVRKSASRCAFASRAPSCPTRGSRRSPEPSAPSFGRSGGFDCT